jgi:hypothetical protein
VARKSLDFSSPLVKIGRGGNQKLMQFNNELPKPRPQAFQPFRTAKPAKGHPQVPQITIRGDNNLISVGTSGVVKISGGEGTDPHLQPVRNGQWPQQILDAIRVKAAKNRRSNDEVCELAGRVLGRAVVTLEKLTARELARVYEAVCSGEWKAY